MKIRVACVEDGLENIGFRKMSAFIKSIHQDTEVVYAPTGNHHGFLRKLFAKEAGELSERDIHIVGEFLAEGDLVGLSSMTQYSSTVHEVISVVRRINPQAYIVWGGIHPIIYPEDAIKHADAVCTGEGEFAFQIFLELFNNGKDYSTAPGFWFRTDRGIIKNTNLPLMTQEDMDELPPLMYQDGEFIYHRDKGVKFLKPRDVVQFNGLSYSTVWSIGCPLQCTYCGNTKFIEYDKGYRRVRHSSPSTIIGELERTIRKHPHISTVLFHDDSFLALPYKVLEEFSDLYKSKIEIPFAVYGVIPNYVREEKIALLLDAGMNRVRMGIQSGSQTILDFYQRPTPLRRIREATTVFNSFRKYMIPPAYDIIVENPIETPDDTRATLDLLHEMPRPFTLNIFALRVIPNTTLAKDIEEKNLDIPPIDKSYQFGYHPTLGTILVFALVVWKMPRWLFRMLRGKVYPVHHKQPKYPIIFALSRMAYLVKRAIDHLRFMDFSTLRGKTGYFLWKTGVIRFWQRYILKRYQLARTTD
jgi:radical SAM superfamily enzyme YgiQ (UPF0313 family)